MNDDLNELRFAYEQGSGPVGDVCAKFDINKSRLYRLVKKYNWQKRRKNNTSTNRSIPSNAATHETTETQTAPLQTLEKLRNIARQYVADLEDELAGQTSCSSGQSSGDREKSVRSLRMLLKIIEEIVELENRFIPALDEDSRKEIDHKQRQDLARRIKALRVGN